MLAGRATVETLPVITYVVDIEAARYAVSTVVKVVIDVKNVFFTFLTFIFYFFQRFLFLKTFIENSI